MSPFPLLLATICSVHDGDTVRASITGYQCVKIRFAEIDAPELADSPSCHDQRRATAWCDNGRAIQSRDELAKFLRSGKVYAQLCGVDRYNRVLAKLSVNGRDAGAYLVSRGLATSRYADACK